MRLYSQDNVLSGRVVYLDKAFIVVSDGYLKPWDSQYADLPKYLLFTFQEVPHTFASV